MKLTSIPKAGDTVGLPISLHIGNRVYDNVSGEAMGYITGSSQTRNQQLWFFTSEGYRITDIEVEQGDVTIGIPQWCRDIAELEV